MANDVHLRLKAADKSYFAILKKEIHNLAIKGGIKERRVAEMDIIVAEIVTNLAKHAVDGEVLVKLIEEQGIRGLEIISIDNGPGMADVRSMMQDGASTKHSLGQGLGAIKRLSDFLQIYSLKGWGTILVSRIYNQPPPDARIRNVADIKYLVLPKPGETECGDGFYVKQTKEHIKLFLGDGLGHGQEAALAVERAIEAFKLCPDPDPSENLRYIHGMVKKTRGLVATIAIFNIPEKKWKICGVGNISTRVQSAVSYKNHNPYNGIVGHNIPKTLNDLEVSYEPNQYVIMNSDGFKSKWDILKFPGILRYDLSVLNASVFKDFSRNTDDTSIVTCKINM